MKRLTLIAASALALGLAACGGTAGGGAATTPTATAVATPTDQPVSNATPATTPTPQQSPTPLPAIVIQQPAAGATVHSPFHATGTADVFEAQFVLEVQDASGHVIASQQVHATSGTGTRGTFDATVTFMGSGPATLVAYERSPKDGSPVNVVRVPLTLA
jgi:hypothetical protein